MPRFFFHVRDGIELLDHDGLELPNLGAARAEAVRASSEAIREIDPAFWEHDGAWEMIVKDEAGEVAFILYFGTALGPASSE